MEESETRGIDPFEYVMLALRTDEGFSLLEYEGLFGVDFLSGREDKLRSLSDGGFVSILNGRLSLTPSGFYVSNSILADLL